MMVFPSVKILLDSFVSSGNFARIIPIITPKMIIGNISPAAKEVKGFSGIILTIVSVIDWFMVTFDVWATDAKFKPRPGLINMPMKRAIVTATAVVKM